VNKMDRTTADIVAEMQRYGITRFGELPPSALGFPDLGDNVSIVRWQGPTPGVPLQQTPGSAPLPAGRPRLLSPSGSMASKRWIKQPGTLAEAEAAGDPLRGAAAVGQGPRLCCP